jgi:hypothetical protein
MEGTPMESMSLLYALLETEPTDYPEPTSPKSAAATTGEPASRAARFRELSEEKKKQVQDGLYKVLYYVIEDHELPHNRSLNRAIGRVLAMAIREQIPNPAGDEDIRRLYTMLKPVVNEAVDEIGRPVV